jgi:hypothetical protein
MTCVDFALNRLVSGTVESTRCLGPSPCACRSSLTGWKEDTVRRPQVVLMCAVASPARRDGTFDVAASLACLRGDWLLGEVTGAYDQTVGIRHLACVPP